MASTATIPPPTIPTNWTDPGALLDNFINYWQVHTFNIFTGLIAALFIFSVFLRTRSLAATLVAAGVVAVVTGPATWLVAVMALAFFALLIRLWRSTGEE